MQSSPYRFNSKQLGPGRVLLPQWKLLFIMAVPLKCITFKTISHHTINGILESFYVWFLEMYHLKRLKYVCILKISASHRYWIIHNIISKTLFIQLTYNVTKNVRISSDTRTVVSCYVSTINCIISMLPGNRLECVCVLCLIGCICSLKNTLHHILINHPNHRFRDCMYYQMQQRHRGQQHCFLSMLRLV